MVAALIKFTGSVTGAGPNGEAFLVTNPEIVTVSNVDNTDVDKWQFELLYVPPGSALTRGVKQAFSSTPTWNFTTDSTECFVVRLRVKDADGVESVDDRVVGVVETSGRLIPPAGATRRNMNVGGQPDGAWPYIRAYLAAVDAVVGGSTVPGGLTTQVQFNDGGVMAGDAGLTYDKTADILTADGGFAAGGPILGAASAYGVHGKKSVAMGDADTVLDATQYIHDTIVATGAMTANHSLTFPGVASEEESYRKTVENATTGGFDIVVTTTEGTFNVAPGDRIRLAFEDTGVVPDFNAIGA